MDDDTEYERKLTELDHLLNDADAPMQPSVVWSLLADLAKRDLGQTRPGPSHG